MVRKGAVLAGWLVMAGSVPWQINEGLGIMKFGLTGEETLWGLFPIIPLGLAWFWTRHWRQGGLGRRITDSLGVLSLTLTLSGGAFSWLWERWYERLPVGLARGLMMLIGFLLLIIPLLLVFKVLFGGRVKDADGRWQVNRGNGRWRPLGKVRDASVIVCRDKQTGREVILPEQDRYMHLLVVGPTGAGKTVGSLNPMAVQDLGTTGVGLTALEPKGDWVGGRATGSLYRRAVEMGRKAYLIDPADEDTWAFNPLRGQADLVAEANRAALQSLFGSQDPFFDKNQGLVLKKVILLLKYLYGDNLNYLDLARNLRDPEELKLNLQRLRTGGIREEQRQLIQWFTQEYLGPQHDEYRKFTVGLRVQVEEMLANDFFRRCIIPRTPGQEVDLDKHLEEGSVLCVSTNDGLLGGLSPVLGRLLLIPMQFAVARRPPGGQPHFLYVDEFATYASRSFAPFLTKARGFKCGCILALQSTAQLKQVEGQWDRGFRDTILGQCRSKVIYGGLELEDVEYFSSSFGFREVEVTSRSTGLLRDNFYLLPSRSSTGQTVQKGERPYFDFNTIKYLPANQLIYELTVNRSLQRARVGYAVPVKDRALGGKGSGEAASDRSGADPGNKRGCRLGHDQPGPVVKHGPARWAERDKTLDGLG